MKEKRNDPLVVHKVRGAFAFLSVLLVIVSQTILYTAPTRQDTGVPNLMWLSLAGVVLFVLSVSLPIPGFLQTLFNHLPWNDSAGWITAAIALSALTAISTVWFGKMADPNYLPVISLWVAGAGCYLVAFAQLNFQALNWKKWLADHSWEAAAVSIVTLLAAILRFYELGTIPRVLNGDEGTLGLLARTTLQNPLANPFALWNNLSAIYLQAVNFVFTIFGPTAFALRLLPAIAGVLSVPAIYLLAREIAGQRVALVAAASLSFSHFDLNFSRTSGSDYIFATLFIPLILYFLLAAFEKRSFINAALAGVLLAVFFCANQMAQVLVGLLSATSLGMLLFTYWRRSAVREWLAFWGGFVILIIPEVAYIWQHPDDFLSRMSSSGTFQTGWLAQTAASTGQPPMLILAQRVVHAFLSLIYYPSLDYYGSPIPPLTLLSAALFLMGLGLCLVRIRNLNYLFLNVYFWGFTFAIGIFAIPPSADTYRMLTVLPAAVVMVAIGLDGILETVGVAWEKNRMGYVLFASLVTISLLATNVWAYYGDFAGRCLYADNTVGRFASYMGSYAGTLRPEASIYLLSDDIYRYGTHASTDFLSGSHPIVNVTSSVDTLAIKPDESIIADPNRFAELEGWAATHPGGQIHYFYDCAKIIMVVDQVP
ncbi:MAG TPA: glycosyltransferase family 39 protein [Anaerolineales bacterium]|nr:glycosyltransferase family 39 protein [Anaerolineales bacterium]